MKILRSFLFSLLIAFSIFSFLEASSLKVYHGKYRDRNLSLNIKARFSSSMVRRNGKKVGRVSRYLIFEMLPKNGREIMNAQIYFQKTFYPFRIGKDKLIINVKNVKQPYKILLIYKAKRARTKVRKRSKLRLRTIYRKIVLTPKYIPGKRRGKLMVKVYKKGKKKRHYRRRRRTRRRR